MIDRLPPVLLAALRKRFLDGERGRLSVHLGNYLLWFGITEVNITTLLAAVLDLSSWEKLEYIVRGMDARVKCERLRQAAKAYRPMGKNLSEALGDFERTCIPLRNRIAHSWPILNHKTNVIHFGSFGLMPNTADDDKWTLDPKLRTIHIDDLFSQAMWLNRFSADLTDTLMELAHDKDLEIAAPIRYLAPEDHPKIPLRGDRAKRRRRAKKPPETRET